MPAGPFILVPLLATALLLCGAVFYRILGFWLVDRTISGFEFFILASVFLSLVALCAASPIAIVALLLFAGVAFVLTFLPSVNARVRMNRLVRDDIINYKAALIEQPDVPYPHRRLAEIYEARGDWDRAIEHYQAYLDLHAISGDISRALERCLEQKRRRDLGLKRCPVCGHDYPPSVARCEECGMYLHGSREIIDALTTPHMMQVWKWLIVSFLIPAVVFAVVGPPVPLGVSLAMLAFSAVFSLILIFGRSSYPRRT